MRKLKRLQALQDFQTEYEDISGLSVPMVYLQTSQVFGFFSQQKLVGGFVLSSNKSLRTIDVFVNDLKKKEIYESLGLTQNYCEVCCFWMNKIYRKDVFFNAWCWLRMAYRVKRQAQPLVLFGTNSQGLALLYALPRNESLLYHQDYVNSKKTYVFLTRRPDFVLGVWKIIWSKLWRLNRPVKLEENDQLRKRIQLELNLNH